MSALREIARCEHCGCELDGTCPYCRKSAVCTTCQQECEECVYGRESHFRRASAMAAPEAAKAAYALTDEFSQWRQALPPLGGEGLVELTTWDYRQREAYRHQVFLDGQPVELPLRANAAEGLVVVAVRGRLGMLLERDGRHGKEPVERELRGRVEIVPRRIGPKERPEPASVTLPAAAAPEPASPPPGPDWSQVAALYADGGCIARNPSPHGGTWCWVAVDAADERVLYRSGILLPAHVGSEAVTNNQAEYAAVARALRAAPDGWSGHVYSDSQVTLGRIFGGWSCAGIPEAWQRAAADRIRRLGPLTAVLLDGHPTREQLAAGVGKRGNPVSRHNAFADEECTRQAREFLARLKQLGVPVADRHPDNTGGAR